MAGSRNQPGRAPSSPFTTPPSGIASPPRHSPNRPSAGTQSQSVSRPRSQAGSSPQSIIGSPQRSSPPTPRRPIPPGPVNKPFRCWKTQPPSPETNNVVPIREGDEGYVTKEGERGWLAVSIPKQDRVAWVSRDFVHVNEHVIYGNVTVHSDIPVLMQNPSVGHISVQGSQLQKAIIGQLEVWFDQRGTLALGDVLTEVIKSSALRHRVTSTILQGCAAANSLTALNEANFSCLGLATSFAQSANFRAPGIYCNIYSRFKSNPEKKPVVRIRKSINIHDRCYQHRQHILDPRYKAERTHMAIARDASDHHHLALCVVKHATERTIAEQLFINLLETWAPNVSGNITHVTDPNNSVQSLLEANSRNQAIAVDARKQILLTEQTSRLTGWPGGVKRASFGASEGLNVTMPVSEGGISYDTIVWSRLDTPTCHAFRRAPVKLRKNPNTPLKFISFVRVATGGRKKFDIALTIRQSINGLREDHSVYPYVEIMREQSDKTRPRHPHSWPRLGGIKCWEYHDDAASLGVGFEFEDAHGTWRKVKLQTAQPGRVDGGGVTTSYWQALSIFDHLMQLVPENPHPWQRIMSPATIHFISFDNYWQKVMIQELQQSQKRPAPKRNWVGNQAAQIRAAGGEALSLDSGWQKHSKRLNPEADPRARERAKCDACQVVYSISRDEVPCVRAGNTATCSGCLARGITCCSWTPNAQLQPGTRLFSLFDIREASDTVQIISDPDIQNTSI